MQKWLQNYLVIHLAELVEEVKTKVYRDSISGLDIDLHPTREKPDEMVKENLYKNLKDNKVAKLMGLDARDAGKIFDDTYTDSIKAKHLIDKERK